MSPLTPHSNYQLKSEQMTILRDELSKIIADKLLTVQFQAIISLPQKKIMGLQALICGSTHSALHDALDLFNAAERFDLTTALATLCCEITLAHYVQLNSETKLVIKISAAALLQPDFNNKVLLALLKQFNIQASAIIIELTCCQQRYDYDVMRHAVMQYREMGCAIALDELGSAYSGLRLWSELLPDYVKLDRYFSANVTNDTAKFNIIRALQSIATSLSCTLIATGVDSKAELEALEQLGLTFVQGDYFGQPAALPFTEIDRALFVDHALDNTITSSQQTITALHIAKPSLSIAADTPIDEVMKLFQHDSELTLLAMLDGQQAKGIIFRDRFLTKLFSNRYGRELYGKKPINMFVDKLPFSVEQNTSIQAVSQQLTSAMRNDLAFVVTNHGDYVGIATVLDLLEEMTRQQIHHAKHANPLTLLPGSVPVNDYIDHLLASHIPFSFAYFDLDNFKPFNDVYGYSAGDDIIKAVASTLTQHVASDAGLVGHIGGDDFIVVFTCADWLAICQAILTTFEQIVPRYYSAEDVANGGIHSETRSGEKCFFPLISLSVGIVSEVSTRLCQSHVDLADLASESKKQAKKIEGNSFFINKRMMPKDSC